MMALSGVRSSWLMLARKRSLARLAFSSSTIFLLERLLEALAFGDIARGGEHALKFSSLIVESRGVVTDDGFPSGLGARGQLVVGYAGLAQNQTDAFFRGPGIGEVIFEGCADQFVPRAAGESLHLLIDVGDDAQRVGGHQRIDVGLDEGPRVELRIAELFFHALFAR